MSIPFIICAPFLQFTHWTNVLIWWSCIWHFQRFVYVLRLGIISQSTDYPNFKLTSIEITKISNFNASESSQSLPSCVINAQNWIDHSGFGTYQHVRYLWLFEIQCCTNDICKGAIHWHIIIFMIQNTKMYMKIRSERRQHAAHYFKACWQNLLKEFVAHSD